MKTGNKTNFDFLKNIDKELFEIITDATKLFQDEYFNQCVVQLRIFGETAAKKILGGISKDMTFDDTINCLKDKIKNDVEREFIDDLFFIKKEGNKCAHGEDTTSSAALEAMERAFEIGINFANAKKGNNEFNNLTFDKTLLITGKEQKEIPLIDKYLKAAQQQQEEQQQKEELLNSKMGDFKAKIETDENGFKDKNKIVNPVQYTEKDSLKPKKRGRKKKELTEEEKETKLRIKNKVKEAKKNIKENINKIEKPKKNTALKSKKTNSKPQKNSRAKSDDDNLEGIKAFLFILFLAISIFILCKMIFIF